MLGLRYLIPYVLPFLLSFCLVYLCYPLLCAGEKKLRIGKFFLMALLLLIGIVLLLAALGCLLGVGGSFLENCMDQADMVGTQCRTFLRDCCRFAQDRWQVDARAAEQIIIERMEVFAQNLQVNLMPRLMRESYGYVKRLASAGAFWGIFLISSLLFAKDFDKILAWLGSRGEDSALSRLVESAKKLGHVLGAYVKAQFKILGVIMLLCLVGLWLGRVRKFYVLAVLAGLLDVLPFIGTGIVLVPTACWQLINGNGWGAAGVLALYGVCVAAREILEPKWIGDGLGISPVLMLFAIFAGVKFFGIAGIIKGPVAAVLIKEVVDKTRKIP